MAKKNDLKDLANAVRQFEQAKTDEERAVAFDAVAEAAKTPPKPASEAEKFKRMLSNDSE